MAKKKPVTVKMDKTNKALQRELLKHEKKCKSTKCTEDNAWINGYVAGANWVLSHIEGY
jgi:hypothetical protein